MYTYLHYDLVALRLLLLCLNPGGDGRYKINPDDLVAAKNSYDGRLRYLYLSLPRARARARTHTNLISPYLLLLGELAMVRWRETICMVASLQWLTRPHPVSWRTSPYSCSPGPNWIVKGHWPHPCVYPCSYPCFNPCFYPCFNT